MQAISTIRSSCLGLLVAVLLEGVAMAGPPDRSNLSSRQWVLIITVNAYVERGYSLPYPLNDARLFERTLMNCCGVRPDHVVTMTERSPIERRPRLENLRRELPRFLDRVGANDRVIVFFSGHGIAQGDKTFLMPPDYSKKEPAQTAWPVAEVRDALARCPAKLKLLVLDCCHDAAIVGALSVDDGALVLTFELKRLSDGKTLATISDVHTGRRANRTSGVQVARAAE